MFKNKFKHCLSVLLLLLLPVLLFGCKTGGDTTVSEVKQRIKTIGSLSWTAPLTYTDGSPMILGGFKIYYGVSSGQYTNYINVGTITAADISNLNFPANQDLYVTVTVYDDAGFESDYTDEVMVIT